AVLVHRGAEQVLDVGSDEHGVGAGGRQLGKGDVENFVVGTGNRANSGDGDGAVRTAEADLVGGERGRGNGLVEGHLQAGDCPGQVAGHALGDDPRPRDVKGSGVLVASRGHAVFARDTVDILVHGVAVDIEDVGPDDHAVGTQVGLGREGDVELLVV